MTMEPIAPIRRCAIYTRKSTNKRLERDVNSLITQREISSAYIKSQQYKGWAELPCRYDDGGHSGSGLERPALARLMQDIEAGEMTTEASLFPDCPLSPRTLKVQLEFVFGP